MYKEKNSERKKYLKVNVKKQKCFILVKKTVVTKTFKAQYIDEENPILRVKCDYWVHQKCSENMSNQSNRFCIQNIPCFYW